MSISAKIKRDRSRDWGIFAISGIVAAYSVIWSWIVLLRFFSFNSNVFDLGLASSYIYSFSHGALFPTAADPRPLPVTRMLVLIFVPFYYIYPDPSWLLVFQTFWLSIGAIPLYKVAKYLFGKAGYAVLLACAYLLYYPLSGAYWFDFHYEAIFPTFFLIGYWLRIANRLKSSTVAFFFAMISIYLAPLTMIFYTFTDLIHGKVSSTYKSNPRQDAVIVILALAVFLGAILYTGTLIPLSYTGITGTDSSLIYNATIPIKAEYLLRMQVPVIFLSFLSPETLLMAVPYYALAFVNSYQPFLSTMYFQYPALTAPIIFLSAIYGLYRISGLRSDSIEQPKTHNGWKAAVGVIFVVSLLTFSFYSPIGELYNSYSAPSSVSKLITGNDYSYNAASDIVVQDYDVELASMIKEIPKGSSVLIQNNMPQLTAGYNWSLPDFLPTGFVPQYIVIDPYSYYYANYSAPYHPDNYTMKTLSAQLTNGTNYTVLAQYNLIVIYQRA